MKLGQGFRANTAQDLLYNSSIQEFKSGGIRKVKKPKQNCKLDQGKILLKPFEI